MLNRVAAVNHVARGVMQVQASQGQVARSWNEWGAGQCPELSKNPATLFFLLTCPLFFLLTPHEENSANLWPDFIPRVCSEFRQRKQPAVAGTPAAAVSTGCTPCTRT